MLSGATRKSRQMSSRDDSDPVMIGPTRRATRPCIRTNEYQRRLVSLDIPRGRRELDPAVHADRVVDAGDQRQPEPGDAEHAVGQDLVVVHDVEVGAAGPQRPAGRAG